MARNAARSIHRKLIAVVAAAALLITALGASQAQAQNRNAERALAALLGLAVVGAIIVKIRNDDRKSHVVTRGTPHHDGFRDTRRYDRGYQGHEIKPRPLPNHVQRHLLPADCLREVRTHHGGNQRAFGGHCLHQNGYGVSRR